MLQKKHEAILANYQPTIIRTTLTMSATPTWTRIRVDADSRQAAETFFLEVGLPRHLAKPAPGLAGGHVGLEPHILAERDRTAWLAALCSFGGEAPFSS